MARVQRFYPYFFLAAVAIIAYWPMSLMIFSAKNDAIHYFLAMRHNSSEMIRHALFPGWTPYINLGYPLHGDIQSGAWNPFVFFMSLLRQYDLYWLHTEIILVNIMAGVGMYRLLRYLRMDLEISLGMAIAYMLSGYMSDAGQFLNWLYAGALIPFVFHYALRATRTFQWKDAAGLGLFFSLLLLCGYPADTILCAYLLLAWFIVSLIRSARGKNRRYAIQKHLIVAGISALSFLLICLPALVSFLEFFPLVRRGAGVEWYMAASNSLAPANLVSFLYPWITLKGGAFSETDPLIRNCYMGILALVALASCFLANSRERPLQRFLAWTALVFLVFALGKFGGLRWITYQVLPMMDTFRHPANAKLFVIFAAQLLAAFSLEKIFAAPADLKKFRIGLLLAALLSGILFILSLIMGNPGQIFRGGINPLNFREQWGGWDLLTLNTLFLLALIVASLFFLKKYAARALPWLVAVEMILMVQVMMPLTYVRHYRVGRAEALLKQQPRGYPLPSLETTLAENSEGAMRYFEEIGCINPYNKRIGRADYIITPSNLASQEAFWEDSLLREEIMNRPLFYFADTVFHSSDSSGFLEYAGDRAAIWTGREETQATGSSGEIRMVSFGPMRMELETSSTGPGILVFMQNYYPRWTAHVNGSELEVHRMNRSFMAVMLAPGRNNLVFEYHTQDLEIMGIISLLAFLAAFSMLVIRKIKKA